MNRDLEERDKSFGHWVGRASRGFGVSKSILLPSKIQFRGEIRPPAFFPRRSSSLFGRHFSAQGLAAAQEHDLHITFDVVIPRSV